MFFVSSVIVRVDAFFGLLCGVILLAGLIYCCNVKATPVSAYMANGFSHGCR